MSQNADRFERRETVAIENEGQTLFGILHRPIVDGPVPAVTIAHGFGGNKLGPTRIYVEMAERLARNGVAALRFDFRGCGDSEGRFSDMTIESLVSDLLRALDHLVALPECNGKVGILGASLGGPVSVMAARQCQDLESLALWAPVAEGKKFQADWEKHKPSAAQARHVQQAGPQLLEQFLALKTGEELAHLHHLPFFHVHGQEDTVVYPHHADVYRAARNGIDRSQFISLPRSDHSLCNDVEERASLLEATALWFRKTLGE